MQIDKIMRNYFSKCKISRFIPFVDIIICKCLVKSFDVIVVLFTTIPV